MVEWLKYIEKQNNLTNNNTYSSVDSHVTRDEIMLIKMIMMIDYYSIGLVVLLSLFAYSNYTLACTRRFLIKLNKHLEIWTSDLSPSSTATE